MCHLSPLQAFMMRMIESVDSVVTRPSEDLWAEICSCLPRPDQKDVSEAFTDSFLDSYTNGGSQGNGVPSQPNPKPWAPLNDSEVYLASLGECWVGLWVLCWLRCLLATVLSGGGGDHISGWFFQFGSTQQSSILNYCKCISGIEKYSCSLS